MPQGLDQEGLFFHWNNGYVETRNLKNAELKRTREGLTGSYKLNNQPVSFSLISNDEDDFTMGMSGVLKVKSLKYGLECRELFGYLGE